MGGIEQIGESKNRVTATTFPCKLGWVAVAWRGDDVTCIVFGSQSQADVLDRADMSGDVNETLTPGMEDLVARLQRFTQGARDDFLDVALDWSGRTPFQRDVLRACRKVPYGTVVTFGQLAAAAGGPRSARAVANVMARNRIPLIIPCHRVVAASGLPGGSLTPEGVQLKLRLLQLEGAPLPSIVGLGAKKRRVKRASWDSSPKMP